MSDSERYLMHLRRRAAEVFDQLDREHRDTMSRTFFTDEALWAAMHCGDETTLIMSAISERARRAEKFALN